MDLFVQYLRKELHDMQHDQIRLRVIGDRQPLGQDLCGWIERAEASTRNNQRFNLTVAVNYGGQWDILQATRRWQASNSNSGLGTHQVRRSLARVTPV